MDEFRYQATDGLLTSAVAMVEIRVGRAADLSLDGFVDFEDLTSLLANWGKIVSAAEGNIVGPGSAVDFADLTELLAAWTGSGGAASPQAAVSEASTSTRESRTAATITAKSELFDRLGRRGQTASQRAGRRNDEPISRVNPLRRLQASAIDQTMAEESTSDTASTLRRRARHRARR